MLNAYTTKAEVQNAVAFVNDVTILGTNTAAAIERMRQDVFSAANGDRNSVDNIAIVVSDGQSNIRREDTIASAEQARNAGIRLMAVGLGSNVDRSEIEGIASSPGTNAFYLEDNADMSVTVDAILNQICQ